MKKRSTVIVGALALLLPGWGSAVLPKKKVITQWKTAMGPEVTVDRWGSIRVVLAIRKRTTILGTRKTIARKITAVRLPVWPNQGGAHTIGLNQEVIPLLSQEVLREQFATNVDYISEATDTSIGFEKSLQVALANGRRV